MKNSAEIFSPCYIASQSGVGSLETPHLVCGYFSRFDMVVVLKRLSEKHKIWLASRAKQSERRKLFSKYRKKLGRWNKLGYKVTADPPYKPSKPKPLNLFPPSKFSLSENYSEVIQFIHDFRETAFIIKRRMVVRIDRIESISPGAALLLAAEIDRWRKLIGTKLNVYHIGFWQDSVRLTLEEMGFFSLLKVDQKQRSVDWGENPPIRIIKFMSGNEVAGEFARKLRIGIEEFTGPILSKYKMFDGITEAMSNVLHHAYPDSEDEGYLAPPLRNQWWLCGAYIPEEEILTITFIDQGVGIPNTLPKSKWNEKIKEILKRLSLSSNDDSAMIRAAMEVRRTSVPTGGRGYGLDQIRLLVSSGINNRLRIISGKGEYIYENDDKQEIIEHEYDIGGTLIEWQICLNSLPEVPSINSEKIS